MKSKKTLAKRRRRAKALPSPKYINPDDIKNELEQLLPEEKIVQIAKETGFIKRERIIDPVPFLWALILGFGTYLQRTLADLRNSYVNETGEEIAESSWHGRFSPALVKFLKACVLHALHQTANDVVRQLDEKVKQFEDILIQDSTIIRLHEVFANKWPAVRSRKVAAGIKVSVLISAVVNGPKKVTIHSERTAEVKTLRIGKWIKDRILLFDLGFFKHHIFARIDENGGFFVIRLKSRSNPLLLKSHKVHRGQAIDLTDMPWNKVKDRLHREVLDAEVEVSFKRRKYKGKQKTDKKLFRLVAIYDKEEGDYHTYLTNIPPDVLSAEEIASLYRVRWEIELLFKELKSKYALDKVKTTKSTIVFGLIWTSILTLIVSRRLYSLLLRSVPRELVPRYTPLRWSKAFVDNGQMLLDVMMGYIGFEDINERAVQKLAWLYEIQALDPHVKRHRVRDDWYA